MDDELWFVICAENDCLSGVVGPLFSYEDAQKECNVECENAHFISRRIPPPQTQISHPISYDPIKELSNRSYIWRRAHHENAVSQSSN